MCICEQKEKLNNPRTGYYDYVFLCIKPNGKRRILTITATNDSEAKGLVELNCSTEDDYMIKTDELERFANSIEINIEILNGELKEELNNNIESGSTFVQCDENFRCDFHNNEDSFIIEEDDSNVRVIAYPDNVKVYSVLMKGINTNKDYIFHGDDISHVSYTKKLKKGEYQIIPKYGFTDTGGSRGVKVFVHWK